MPRRVREERLEPALALSRYREQHLSRREEVSGRRRAAWLARSDPRAQSDARPRRERVCAALRLARAARSRLAGAAHGDLPHYVAEKRQGMAADALLPAALLERGLAGLRLRGAGALLAPPPALRAQNRRDLQRRRPRPLDAARGAAAAQDPRLRRARPGDRPVGGAARGEKPGAARRGGGRRARAAS